ncbi:hypothetical protein Tco_0859258 [Tanacetum coccineum]|uniref:Uncharacterized protein n=1 Tax=Tanacetum coccineum TaxID=301880 RepID=A0ABQ5BBH5_9ASTR
MIVTQMKHKEDNKNDEQPNKRVCKAEKFEAIKYSLGPKEKYIAIGRCEYNVWERNEDCMSQIYQEIFQKKDNGWKVLAEKKSTKLVKYRSSGILLIMEYLVNISKKARILELKQRPSKITVLTSNTPYPSRKIRRICSCTSLKTTKDHDQYAVSREYQYAMFKL